MAAANIFVAFGGALNEAPRLTTMLRAFTTERGAAFDVDEEFLKRRRALDARRKRLGGEDRGLGETGLAQQLFGSWGKTPRFAKESYNMFLKAVADLVSGQPSSEELQEYAWVVWRACKKAPDKDKASGRGMKTALRPMREALVATFGTIEDDQLQKTVFAYHALKECHEKATKGEDKKLPSRQKDTNPYGSTMEEEFGANIKFRPPAERSRDAAVLAMCGIHKEDVGPGINRQPSAGPLSAKDLAESFARAPPAPEPVAAQTTWEPEYDSDDAKGTKQRVTLKWLREWVERMSKSTDTDVEDLGLSICQTILTSQSGDQLADELCGLLGWEALELVQELVEHRSALQGLITAGIDKAKKLEAAERGGSSFGSAFTITSEYEKQQQKLERKGRKKKGGLTGTHLEWLSAAGFSALLEAAGESKVWMFGGVFDLSGGTGGEQKSALPANSTRKSYQGYEEVIIPAKKPEPLADGESLVKIGDLEEWAQLAFQGYKTLNRIQSKIYQSAFHSNENILVCAPTGAGKTNIAMITILREISLHMRYMTIQKGEFKIVYVAPMKALAAEMTATFGKRLAPLGLTVKELTGDMQLTKRELAATQMIVTTPEKWDVITRKGSDVSIASLVKLLIIDEVHLLNDDRGPVIETLIARTLRQVEVSQSMIRIVGLSATLPNYKDVSTFLSVNEKTGLFYFDQSYRPVPLALQFVGVSEANFVKRNLLMMEICYEKVASALKRGKQAMVFVHSRKDTGKTARGLAQIAAQRSETEHFSPLEHPQYGLSKKAISKSRNREMSELFSSGLGIHHAGMLRSDRNLMERNFSSGMIKVLCCTATLAWGVNLPAHTVVIKGTQLYDAQKGGFKDLGMLDVQQIFGRAGRPQFDHSGEGIIITSHEKLAHYLGMLTHQAPIESQFTKDLVDHLNAEIVLGTVTNLREASTWLSYTYLFVRMVKNPRSYGLTWEHLLSDPQLDEHRVDLIKKAARELEDARMARFDEKSSQLYVTELGRVASHYYIKHDTIRTFNECLKKTTTAHDILVMLSKASEFESMAVREEELIELDEMLNNACPYGVRGGVEDPSGKANVLMQAYVSRQSAEAFSLVADMMYVAKNAPRICRAVFEICLRRGWSTVAEIMLNLCKAFELRLWPHQHPFRQFESIMGSNLLDKLEKAELWLDQLYDLDKAEISRLLQNKVAGDQVLECLDYFPSLELDVAMQPITRTVIQVRLKLAPAFKWKDRHHGSVVHWLILVEDSENDRIYHYETWLLTKAMMKEETHKMTFTIPIHEPVPTQYYIRAISDSWMGAETVLPVSFKSLILPQRMAPHTELLDLDPLPVTVLGNEDYQSLYRFSHFNPIQTQAFHTLYHTDKNVLLGAPTGSGKTISAELAMLRVFSQYPDSKVIYIAPLKALVRERLDDWGKGLCPKLNKRMVELTGDYTPDIRALTTADIIIATPEKWDGISRNWQSRSYVRKVCLMVFDEIHLLGSDRGPIIEVIVSRMRYIASQLQTKVRFLGLSTALANAPDVADWMGVDEQGLFNFRPSVRPVPLQAHIQGYSGKFYCPRMATMNKPTYAAIQTHSPIKPVIVFVSSRRQTRLTALDLIAFAAADERPQQWVHMHQEELEEAMASVRDANLKHTLQFGIGMHHAGLNDRDRSIVETLFVEQKIQILTATATLAWGVNTPAHLVVIKGTEYFDPATRRYVDFPITDVLQMMGRAGRPQYDKHGVAVIMVHEPKKAFYKKFLYEPFPVESSLPEHVPDHLNAEIVGGTIASKQDALDYLTWTYFFRRLLQNPSFYGLEDTSDTDINQFLSQMVETSVDELERGGCILINEGDTIEPLTMGRIASFFYLKHETMFIFNGNLTADLQFKDLLQVLCHAAEYDELPVRHNEDKLNSVMAQQVRWRVDPNTVSSPNTKANLLLQAHMSRMPLPISDYVTDTKTVLDNSLRVLQAMVDICADAGWLATALNVMNLVQSILQGRWVDESSMLTIPHLTPDLIRSLEDDAGIFCVPQLVHAVENKQKKVLEILVSRLGKEATDQVNQVLRRLPVVKVNPKPARLVRPIKKKSSEGKNDGVEKQQGEEVEEQEEDDVCMLEVELMCHRGQRRGRGANAAFAPRFPKVKDEGWWLVVGDASTKELHALRRMSFRDDQRTTTKLRFPASGAIKSAKSVTLFLMSDCYLGLDQQYQVSLPWAA
ncbi:hypothetical protein BSKO_00668 [Bryopsis sp. KO-2023]|nr:hypothetical protein BSKO_00668 [Bryopsis sp. KO-2023]